jgi:hypothetical protein
MGLIRETIWQSNGRSLQHSLERCCLRALSKCIRRPEDFGEPALSASLSGADIVPSMNLLNALVNSVQALGHPARVIPERFSMVRAFS